FSDCITDACSANAPPALFLTARATPYSFLLPLKHEGSGAPRRRFDFFEPWPCGHGAPFLLEKARAFRRSAAVSVTASGPRSPRTGLFCFRKSSKPEVRRPCGY